MYVLISRTTISREWWEEGNRERWEAWLRERDEKKELGHNVSRKIRELVERRIDEAKKDVDRMKKEVEAFKKVERWLKKNDIDAVSWYFSTSTLDRLLEEHERGFTSSTLSKIAEGISTLQTVYRILAGDDEDPREGRRHGGKKRVRRKVRVDEVEGDEVEFGRRVRIPSVQVNHKGAATGSE
jgi:hypothetical protein